MTPSHKPLHVMHLLNSGLSTGGGVVSSVIAQTEGLIDAGHKVSLVTLDFKEQETDRHPYSQLSLKAPFHFTYNKRVFPFPWRLTAQLKIIIQQIKPDIIHVHHPFLIGPAAYQVARSFNIPQLFTHHTRYEQYLHYFPVPTFITHPLTQKAVNNFCQKVTAVIAPSKEIFADLKHAAPMAQIEYLPSPIMPLFFHPKNLHPFHNPVRLLTASRFVVEKNIPFLLDTFSLLPHNKFIFTLVGYGPHESYLRNYAYQHLALSPQELIFKRVVSKQELSNLYAESDLFLFASTTETQGLVLAEAMAASTPVIALNGPGQREIIHHGHNGYIVSSCVEMAKNIQQIVDAGNVAYATLQKNAWKTAQHYRFDTIIPSLITLYRKVMI